MRSLITSAAASLAVLFALGPANAMPVDRTIPAAVPSNVEQAQFFFGGRNYCWYDDGWRGPGYYWCGYAWRRGYGWGGGEGWRGWGRGGPGPMVGRPGPGRGPVGRPGPGPGGRPGMVGRPGGPGAGAYVRPGGGGRPAGGRPAPHH